MDAKKLAERICDHIHTDERCGACIIDPESGEIIIVADDPRAETVIQVIIENFQREKERRFQVGC